MVDPQELANRIGATQRATEEALVTGRTSDALGLAQQQHANLTEGFAYLRDVAGIALDWNAVAGREAEPTLKGKAQTRGGGAKDSPPVSEA